MATRLIKKIMSRGAEALLAFGLVLAFFLVFLVILSASFPRGSSLRDILGASASSDANLFGSDVEMSMRDDAAEVVDFVAKLFRTKRTVKGKRADSILWETATEGQLLENMHSVQTFARSGAEINFQETSRIRLDEKTLVVIRRMERNVDFGWGRASMLLLTGELEGRNRVGKDTTVELEVVTATGSRMTVPGSRRSSEFKVKNNPDRTSTFSIFSGQAKVTSGGRTVVLQPNQTVTVAENQAPGIPVDLPFPPVVLRPAAADYFSYRSTPPNVEFAWSDEQEVDAYRLRIATDAEFLETVYSGQTSEPLFRHGNLNDGAYYWQVSSVRGWSEGQPSPPRRFDVERDELPPLLSIEFPGSPVAVGQLLLTGSSEPGSEIFHRDQSLTVGQSGEFEISIALDPGINVVVIEAIDSAGNVAYQSDLLHAKK